MKNRILPVLLALVLCLGLMPLAARAAEVPFPVTGGNITFDTDTGTVTGSDESVTAAEIPAEIAGARVTAIGEGAFSYCSNLTSIRLPDTLASIGGLAFEACALVSVVIPDSVTDMEGNVFSACTSLTSVTLGKGLTALPGYTFEGCSALTDLTIPEGYLKIENGAFDNCRSLKWTSMPASLTGIEGYAFNYCDSLSDVYFAGDQAQWNRVGTGGNNEDLNNATIHFNATGPSSVAPSPVTPSPVGPVSEWAKPEMERAEEMNLIPDVLRGEDLTKPITRAEFAAVSVKVFENLSGTKALPAVTNPFTDTRDTEVLKAYNTGITNGTSATTFDPDVLLNREQCAVMLTRVFKRATMPGWSLDSDSQFKLTYAMPARFADDADISGWAKDSVYFMAANKIINGVGDNRFVPRNTTTDQEARGYANATREQALAIAVRMVENLN